MGTEQGIRQIAGDDVIDVGVLRDFILQALRHEAVADALIERMDFHAQRHQLDAVGLAAVLPELIGDVLAVATKEDWTTIAEALIGAARDDLPEGRGAMSTFPRRPDAPSERRRLLHSRLDVRGRPICATSAVLGRWDLQALVMLASHPEFDPYEFTWVGPEYLGDGVLCISIYTGLAADSPYLWITQKRENPETYLICLYVCGADGEEAEDPFLVSECAGDDLAAKSLRMIASARSSEA